MQNGISNFTPKTAFHALDYNDSSTISGWAMPSSRYINLTLGASGASYTAPANGWIGVSASANQNGWISILENNFNVANHQRASWVDNITALVPIAKGYTWSLSYGAIASWNYFRFYYTEGENV